MNANELMIGDWVYNKHHKKNIQITPYDFFTHGHLPSGRQYFIGEPELVSGRDLEPILLTPEILEKIGFETQPNIGYIIDGYDGTQIIYDRWNNNLRIIKDYKTCLDIKTFSGLSVHELQHALRICEIEKEIKL